MPCVALFPRPQPALLVEKIENLLALDALQIELGYGLVSLADTRKGGDLLERVTWGPAQLLLRKWVS